MRHTASSRFWACFDTLPNNIQTLARHHFELLKKNPAHPSLHFKRLKTTDFYSVRVGISYRAVGVAVDDGVQWFWIGTHADYDKLLS